MSWITAAAIVGGSSLLSAKMTADAAKNAANAQLAAAAQATALQQQQFNTIQQEQAPQRAIGYSALNQIGAL